jgi:hypothetical protein
MRLLHPAPWVPSHHLGSRNLRDWGSAGYVGPAELLATHPWDIPGASPLTLPLLDLPGSRPSRDPNAADTRRAGRLGSLQAIGRSPLQAALADFAARISSGSRDPFRLPAFAADLAAGFCTHVPPVRAARSTSLRWHGISATVSIRSSQPEVWTAPALLSSTRRRSLVRAISPPSWRCSAVASSVHSIWPCQQARHAGQGQAVTGQRSRTAPRAPGQASLPRKRHSDPRTW